MFAAARANAPQRSAELQQTTAQMTEMTPSLQEIFKRSLKSNRWESIDLGPPANYTHENMVNRWTVEKNRWLQVSAHLAHLQTNPIILTRAFSLFFCAELTCEDGSESSA